jgi:hypothetical protein
MKTGRRVRGVEKSDFVGKKIFFLQEIEIMKDNVNILSVLI